jgi:hypothetical protein
MADPTEAELKAAARKALAAGDTAAAKRLVGAARKAAESAAPTQSDAMKAGLASLSAMTQNPVAAYDAEQERRASERGWGAMLYDNIIGAEDGVDSPGERFGRTLDDVAKAAGAGAARGTAGLVGLPGTINDLTSEGLTYAGKKIGLFPEDAQSPKSLLSSSSLIEGLSAATGGATDYRGQGTAAKYAGTVGEFLPGAVVFGGVNPVNLVKYGVLPGATSEAAGQATEGSPYEGFARFAGALLGGTVPGLVAQGAAKLVSPYGGADPVRLKLANVLDDFGVPITAGQRTGAEALRRKEALTSGGQRIAGEQQEAFTAAVLKTAGIDARRATPEVLDDAATRIGTVFEDATKGVDVAPSPDDLTALSGAVSTYGRLAPTGNRAPLVSEVFRELTKAFRGGNTVPASTVNTWRSGLSKLTTSADAATREAALAALGTIDDMLANALRRAGRADDVARLATARSEWRNFLAIQKAAVREGDGLLSPARVRASVIQQGEGAYARGKRGDLGALARAGGEVMEALPNSGTPAGIRAMIPGGSLSAVLGAGFGSGFGPGGAALGALGGLALPAVAGAVRMFPMVQRYLANQALAPVQSGALPGAASAALPFLSGERNALAVRP